MLRPSFEDLHFVDSPKVLISTLDMNFMADEIILSLESNAYRFNVMDFRSQCV